MKKPVSSLYVSVYKDFKNKQNTAAIGEQIDVGPGREVRRGKESIT